MPTKAVLLVDSQPPHTGEYLQAFAYIKKYDFLYVCLTGPPLVLPIVNAMTIWKHILEPFAAKTQVTYVALKFTEIMQDELPLAFDNCVYLTSDKETFVHLSSLSASAELIPKVPGYRDIFLRTAYRQGVALDWLENHAVVATNNK